jgi:hypothetical protein
VFPQKNVNAPTFPEGGKINVSASLRQALDQMIRQNRLDSQTPIAFEVRQPRSGQRKNEVRETLLTVAFGTGNHVAESAGSLSLRLSTFMDERSHPFLLLLSVFRDQKKSTVVLFAFPRDEGFRFSMTSNGANVEVVRDIFNISSNLKKAAMFTGVYSDDSFWEGRMVDLQSGRTDLWVERFLACQLSVSGLHGTSLLSEYLTTAYRETTSQTVREELFNAIIAVRTAPFRRMSFLRFANDYLGNDAKSEFLSVVPPDSQNMSFDFDRATFERKVGVRVFRMADNVIVAAPFPAINKSLMVNQDQLEYTGTITREYLKGGKSG